jgi:hypothetical protein
MSFYDAKKHFEENVKLFKNADINPEKYNLYAGLVNLTKSLIQLDSSVDDINRKLKNQ